MKDWRSQSDVRWDCKCHVVIGRAFWSRGYGVSTVGLDEAMISRYIQDHEKDERDQERGLFSKD